MSTRTADPDRTTDELVEDIMTEIAIWAGGSPLRWALAEGWATRTPALEGSPAQGQDQEEGS